VNRDEKDVWMKREPRLVIPPPPPLLVAALFAVVGCYTVSQFAYELFLLATR
jgi:hypothetical protein